MEEILFYVFATMTVLSAVLVVAHRHPVYSAVFLIQTLFAVAGLFLLLNAQFIAAIQVLVYAGAIMVLFLFVVMLLNLGRVPRVSLRLLGLKIAAGAAVVALLYVVIITVRHGDVGRVTDEVSPGVIREVGHTELIGQLLFTEFLFPFEVVSVLLLAAMVGVVVLAKQPAREPREV